MFCTWLRHRGAILTLVMLLGLLSPLAPARAEETGDGYLPGEVLVKLGSSAHLADIAREYHLDPAPIDQFGSRPIYRLRIADGASPVDRAVDLTGDPQGRVKYAEPNYVGQTPEGRQKSSWFKGEKGASTSNQWAMGAIGLPDALKVSRGAGITVAILDTGVDATHPALDGHLRSGYDFVDMDTDPSEVGNHEANVAYGHGTHVAGLVAATAPDAKILPLRVLDADGTGNVWVLAEALAYAVNPDGDPTTQDGADVINLSLSTTRKTNLLGEISRGAACEGEGDGVGEDLCVATGGRGAVVVAAAGNSGTTTPEYPAAENVGGMLAVAASTPDDALASFSTRGDWVKVRAPGENILSTVPGGEYGVWSGTSMAAPLVAGEAALIFSLDPSLAPTDVTKCVISGAVQVGGPAGRRIDALASLHAGCGSASSGGDS